MVGPARVPPPPACRPPGSGLDSGIAAKAHLRSWRFYLISFNVSSSLLNATLVLRIADASGAAVGEAEELRIVKNPEDDGHFHLVGTSA